MVQRYVQEKLENLYPINDDLFVVIDSLMTDSRWDMKFLGIQIMVEGLALGAFGTLYKTTRELLLRELLRQVIRDEARHVHYGVLALRHHFREVLGERDRREREEWAFEVALLMRDRFRVQEVFDRHYAGRIDRATWHAFVDASPGMRNFRRVMFTRLVPNLREIGLITPRIPSRYESAGLGAFVKGRAADVLSGDEMVSELEVAAE